jgi:hypothetical protein
MKMLRPILVILVFAAIGLLAFYLTALTSGEPWAPAWEKEGLSGVVLWAYERGSFVTVAVLFLLALVCGWLMPFNRLLAAVSLALFYPVFAILRMAVGTYTANLVPFEFLGYLFFIVISLLGYAVGRWISRRVPKPTPII